MSQSRLLPPLQKYCLPFLIALIIKIISPSFRIHIQDDSGFLAHSPIDPRILLFWHNRIIAISIAFLRYYPKHHPNRKGVSVLTSASKDGDLLSNVMSKLGIGSIRGSTSRRGSIAIRELIALLKSGIDIAITPDGPRGPKYSLQSGALFLAQTTGIPILPIHAHYHRAIHLKTWDNFAIPLPFSKIDITLFPYLTISPSEDLETQRLELESLLKQYITRIDSDHESTSSSQIE